MSLSIVFMGTAPLARASLEALLVAPGLKVAAVVTQPDRPKGRDLKLQASAVKEAALRFELPVWQPEEARHPAFLQQLRDVEPDLIVVAAYGQILPPAILELPRLGCLNVHTSLLPKYRGAAPIQWAIANGETQTGVTTMQIDAGLDTGDMLLKWETPIGVEENALELGARLAEAGAELLIQTLRENPPRERQNPAEATYAPIIKKEDGEIDWSWPAVKIFNRSRGLLPWPGTYSYFRGQLFHIWKSRMAEDALRAVPGRMIAQRKRLLIASGEGTTLEALEVQVEGRRRMPAEAFLNGQRLSEHEILGKAA